MSNDWFTVHREGLAQQLARKGPAFAVLGLTQKTLEGVEMDFAVDQLTHCLHTWDAPGVTSVSVRLLSSGRGEAERAFLSSDNRTVSGVSDDG